MKTSVASRLWPSSCPREGLASTLKVPELYKKILDLLGKSIAFWVFGKICFFSYYTTTPPSATTTSVVRFLVGKTGSPASPYPSSRFKSSRLFLVPGIQVGDRQRHFDSIRKAQKTRFCGMEFTRKNQETAQKSYRRVVTITSNTNDSLKTIFFIFIVKLWKQRPLVFSTR